MEKSTRGRPQGARLPAEKKGVQVPMRIRRELVPALRALGRKWLEAAIEAATRAL